MFDCCIDTGDDGEAPSLHVVEMRKAQKEHICCECHEPIHPGDTYERVVGVWDGKFDHFKTCAICKKIREDYCCSWLYGGLREALWEVLGFDYTGKIKDVE
jgi:hypothetical protein